jgi:hypothetical protein
MIRIMRAVVVGVFALTLGGCAKVDVSLEDEPKEQPFEVQVNVVSDPGVPVAGAQIFSGTRLIGKADQAGATKVRFGGKDGDSAELMIKCPEDYEAPPPLTVSLRRLAPGSRPPQFEVRCAPTVRTIVVGIRSDHGTNMPITYLGRTVARTDTSGAALFMLRVHPLEQVALTLVTPESESEKLLPPNPTLMFVAKESDDFVVLDQHFTVKKKPARYVPSRPIPTPLVE